MLRKAVNNRQHYSEKWAKLGRQYGLNNGV